MSRLSSTGGEAEVSPHANLSLEAGKRWLERREELNDRHAVHRTSHVHTHTQARAHHLHPLLYRARAQASQRGDLLLYSSLAAAAAGVGGCGAGFAVQRKYFPAQVPAVARAFFVMWAGFMPFMLMKGVTQNKMQKANRAATVPSSSPKPPVW